MNWSEVSDLYPPRVVNECRAGILVGRRIDISDSADAAGAVIQWAADEGGVELWIVDDLCGLASKQPIFAGIQILQAFGLDNDHRRGITMAEYEDLSARATARMTTLNPPLEQLLAAHGKKAGESGAWFVWSGPLCGGFLVKGVFREEYRDEDLWYAVEDKVECPVYVSGLGASQEHAPGGVQGVQLFSAIYDCSNEPPKITREFLSSGDAALARKGLLADSKIHVLSHYD